MRQTVLLLLVFIIFFIAGCASSIQGYTQLYESGITRTAANRPQLHDPDLATGTANVCERGGCVSFVCDTSQSTFFGRILQAFSPSVSLRGNACDFRLLPSSADLNSLFNLEGVQSGAIAQVRPFMIGQGSTFADFGEANQACGNQLDMTVRWLHARSASTSYGRSYPLPQTEVAECFLDIGKMPLYILYSNGNNIDVARAREIAERFKDSGPVIITAEIDFDADQPGVVPNIQSQLIEMKRACPNCIIAVAPRMGDMDGLRRVFEEGSQAAGARDATKLVAFGINTRHSKLDCTAAGGVRQDQLVDKIYREAYEFANDVKITYGKPSIVPYMAFYIETSPTGCEWTSYDVYETQNPNNAYARFFSYYLPIFLRSGIIGVAPYQYEVDVDPLGVNCPSCKLSAQEAKESWYNWCHKYKVENPLFQSGEGVQSGGTFAIYPEKEGSYCQAHTSAEVYFRALYPERDFANSPIIPDTAPPIPYSDAAGETRKQRITCETCASRETTFPFNVGVASGGDPSWCGVWRSPIEKYAYQYDVDPYMVRAIIWHESGSASFNSPNYVGTDQGVCAVGQGPQGSNCYPFGFDRITYSNDPTNSLVNLDPLGVNLDCGNYYGINPRPAQPSRYCAFGLMQVIESPYRYHAGEGGIDSATASRWQSLDISGRMGTRFQQDSQGRQIREDRAIARECAVEIKDPATGVVIVPEGQFNPFQPEHNICAGATKLSNYLHLGKQIVGNNENELADASGTLDDNKKNALAYYFALHYYHGSIRGDSVLGYGPYTDWVNKFHSQRSHSPSSCTPAPPQPGQTGSQGTVINANGRDELAWNCPNLPLVTQSCRDIIGTDDFIWFTRECVFDKVSGGDYAANVLAKYRRFVEDVNGPRICREALCTQGVVQGVQ